MKIFKETERLYLAEATVDDTAFLLELLNSEGWLTFIGDRNVRTEEDARDYLETRIIKSYSGGIGMHNVVLKSTGELLGMCGLIDRPTLEGIDIGYGFLPQYMGKGYAFEAASAVMAFAKNDLKLTEVSAITTQNNFRSQRLLEKLGLSVVKTYNEEGTNEPMFLYKIVF
jgi:RimJ/RimL family protein N-acetyltransferase